MTLNKSFANVSSITFATCWQLKPLYKIPSLCQLRSLTLLSGMGLQVRWFLTFPVLLSTTESAWLSLVVQVAENQPY